MPNPWAADTDTDALAAFREPDDDRATASPRPGVSLGLLVWAVAVALVRWWFS